MITRKILAAVVVAGVSSLATAEMAPYFGVQYGYLDFDRGAVDGAALDAFTLRGGLDINELIAAEARVGLGLSDDTRQGIKTEMNYHYGVYAVINLPTRTQLDPYLLGGYSYVDSTVNGSDYSDDGLAYGAGLKWAMNDESALTLEYLKVADNDYTKQNLISLGILYHF